MKIKAFALALACLASTTVAMADELPPDTTALEIHYDFDTPPQFPAGEAELMKAICMNLRYPDECMDEGIQGRVVLQFTVLADGHVGNFKVLKPINPALEAEAIRVVKLLPEWTPATKNGVPVNANYVLPVNFKLNTPKPSAEERSELNPDLPVNNRYTAPTSLPRFDQEDDPALQHNIGITTRPDRDDRRDMRMVR